MVCIFCNEYHQKMLFSEINLSSLKQNLKEDETNISLLEAQHDIFIYQSHYKSLKTYLYKTFDLIENYNNKIKAKKPDNNLLFNNSNYSIFNDFTERVVAIESLQFILDHFLIMKPIILVNLKIQN